MLFICSHITHKSWIYSLILRRQRTFTSSTVKWMMKRGNCSPPYSVSKIRRTMAQSTDNKFKAAHKSNHASPGNITEITGDLFSCPNTHSLAHCISADVKMGRGIAVTFKNKFKGVSELLSQNQKPGGLAILSRDQRFVYYLVTKEKYWEKPTYETLRSSLERMREHNVKHGVENLCMPKIGCGLDKLQWHKVLAMIREIYKGLDIQITIYHFDDGKKDTGKGRGKQKGFDGNVGADWWRGQHGRPESRTRDNGAEKSYEEVETRKRFDHRREDQHQRSSHQYKHYYRHPGSVRGHPTGEWPPNQRHQNSGETHPRDVQGRWEGRREFDQAGSAERSRWSGKNQEYGPKLPPDKNKKSQQQSSIQGYFTKGQSDSRKGEDTDEDFPALSESGNNKQHHKETRRNEGVVEQRDQQRQTSTNKINSPPVKIKRPKKSRGHRTDESRGGLSNESTDAKKAGDTERKVDDNIERKVEKNDGEPRKSEEGSQEANDSEQNNVCENERQDEEGYQTTTNNSKKQRKRSHDEDRDEHEKDQLTFPEEDKVSQDTDKNTEESETLKGKREDSNTIIQSESHLETKNSDFESPASASESIVENSPPRQEGDGGVTSTDETTGKSTQVQGKDREKDEKKPSGSTVETSSSRKKKKKKNKKKK